MRDAMPWKREVRPWWKYFPSCVMVSSLFVGFGAFCIWFEGDDGLAQTIGVISGAALVLGGAADLICDRVFNAVGLPLRSPSLSSPRHPTNNATINQTLLSSGYI